MILRFLRRSSLNGDSWSIAIPSLPRDASSLPPRRPFFSRGGRRRRASRVGWAEVAAVPAASRCGARAEAARRREGRECGWAEQAKGERAGGWAYMHAWTDSARGGIATGSLSPVTAGSDKGGSVKGGHPAATARARARAAAAGTTEGSRRSYPLLPRSPRSPGSRRPPGPPPP